MGQFVTQDTAARLWMQVIGGEDIRLPPECDNRVGERRKRDEKAKDKGVVEEEKLNPEKR